MKNKRKVITLPIISFLIMMAVTVRGYAIEVDKKGTLYVAKSGANNGGNQCADPANPCLTISYALETADDGDEILVAEGTYIENIVVQENIALRGGYDSLDWKHDLSQYETILDGSGSPTIPGDWDSSSVSAPRVIRDNGTYRMWYDGSSVQNPGWGWGIGRAESTDGIEWLKEDDNPLLVAGDSGEWDSQYRGQVAILKEASGYKMWYAGSDGGARQVGYATSTDGVNWETHAGNPVLATGSPGSWDDTITSGPAIIKDGGLYKMWYHGCNSNYTACSIGYATSPNGVDWTKYANNPVLIGSADSWDSAILTSPAVIKNGNTYLMWYTGLGPEIGLATSPDGIQWTNYPGNPVISESWDGRKVAQSNVLLEDSIYKMWFRAGQQQDDRAIGYAESSDGVTWTMHEDNPVLIPSSPTQWGGPVVRFTDGSDGAVIDGFTITGGSGEEAGGVQTDETEITIRRCLIQGNRAGGFLTASAGAGVSMNGPVTIEDSRIVDNEVDQGAGGIRVHSEGLLVMTNSLVAGNRGDEGLHVNGGVDLMHVTIAYNGVDKGRPGINFNPQTGQPQVMANSILYGNGDPIHWTDDTDLEIRYSIVQDGWEGVGNSDVDPRFVDPQGGNFELLPWSPAIDFIDADSAPDHDLNQDPRPHPHNALVDIGAFEYQGAPFAHPIVYFPMAAAR